MLNFHQSCSHPSRQQGRNNALLAGATVLALHYQPLLLKRGFDGDVVLAIDFLSAAAPSLVTANVLGRPCSVYFGHGVTNAELPTGYP